MKKLFSIVMMLVSACALWAGPIDQQQALEIAQTYLSTHLSGSNAPQHRLRVAYKGADLKTANVETSNLYVFNINEQDGFIVVSGDDRTEAVLGYTENGAFDPDNIPSNLRWWLDCYERQIEWVKANMPEQSAGPAHSSTEVIAPMLTSKWDQGTPYNNQTPTVNGKHAPTGCVATALAQVMYYYKWPVDATASIPGYRQKGSSNFINALPATTFDWDNMIDSYPANMDVNDARVDAVSKLMRYAGQVVHMSYGEESSGSNETDLIPGAMNEYFGYSNSGWEGIRDHYSIAEWEELILNELRNHRPVLYCGYTSSFEGHAFVCDGYNGDGKFYINWGWGGYADGPFRLSVLDASYSGIGGSATSNQFSWGQVAYFEIQPTGESTVEHYHDNLTAATRPSVQNRVVTRNNSSEDFRIRLFMPVHNNTGGYYSKQQGYALYKGDEMVKRVYTAVINMGQGAATYNALTVSLGSNLENGDYTLYAVSQSKSTGQWEKNVGSDRNYVKVNINDNTMTLTPVPFPDFTINDVTAKKNAIVVDFTNNGTEYNGTINLLDSNFNTVSWEQAAIAEGETTQVAFYIGDKSTFSIYDVYYLNVDHWTENWFYTNATLEGADLKKTLSILNLAEDGQTVYGSKVLCQVDLRNEGTGLYKHTITTEIVNVANGNSNTIAKEIVSVEPGESKTLSYEVPIAKAQRGNTFELTSTHNLDATNIAEDKITFIPQAGAILWNGKGEVSVAPQSATFTVDDNAAAADLIAAYTSNAKANSNPNTIYMLDTSVPTGLKGKNVMNSKLTTANIHFYDGNEYFIPVDFSASKTTNYHRTINEANKWSTIALPFAPTQVTADGEAIDWQKSDSDTGKSLYIMKFNGTEGDKVLFGYTDAMEAYTPYLIGISPELAGKELVFSANTLTILRTTLDNPIVATAGNYQLTGVNTDTVIDGAFIIDGDKAKPANGAAVAPFRAYLTAEGGIAYPEMSIITGVQLTGISDIEMTTESNGAVFNLAGQQVGTAKEMSTLPKGIYVVNGKKVIIK